MPNHAAFLRGINLASRRRISGAELRSLFEEMGFRDVDTFRASGNVVFDSARKPAAARIEKALEESKGFEVTVFLRAAGEVRTIAAHDPFDRELVEASNGKLQVAILPAKPAARARKEVLALVTDEDRLAFGDRELYWLPSGLMRETGLNLKAVEKLLGPWTMRTKATIEQMAAKYFAG
jgi:uncharacterized protein (DUF1697 family)